MNTNLGVHRRNTSYCNWWRKVSQRHARYLGTDLESLPVVVSGGRRPRYFIHPMNELLTRTACAPRVVFDTESITVSYDPENRTIWHSMHCQPRPCFTEGFLRDALELHAHIAKGMWPVDFYVLRSDVHRVFNLGGDRQLFRECVLKEDWTRLSRYARMCVDTLYGTVSGLGH